VNVAIYVKNPSLLSILIKLEFSRQVLQKKILKYQFKKNPSCGSLVVPCEERDRRTDWWRDRHEEANSNKHWI